MGRMDSGRARRGGVGGAMTAGEARQIVTMARSLATGGPLCPGCGFRAPDTGSGLCGPCGPGADALAARRRDLARARRARWWAANGRAWRAGRRATAA